jgi:WD40 repeat protein
VFGAPPDSSHPTPKTTASASPVAPGDNQSGRILLLRFSETSPAEYFVVNADGSDEQPFGPRVEYEARQVAPDESLLSIVGPNSEGMIVGGTIGLDGTGFRLFRNPKPSLNLACGIWGPHDRMACEAWSDADPSLNGIRTVLASDGRDPQRLTTGRDVPCDYSPDGSQLAFVRESPHGDGSMLMVMAADGGVPEALLENVATSGLPCDWAPDGSSILTATTDGKLHVVTTKGDSATFVGDGLDGYISNGVWSSDGARVLLTMAPQGEQGDVYTIAADGSDLRRITHSELLEEGIIWLP